MQLLALYDEPVRRWQPKRLRHRLYRGGSPAARRLDNQTQVGQYCDDHETRSEPRPWRRDGGTTDMNIYWAAPFFDEADQRFNAEWVQCLRALGYVIHLPQEQGFNASAYEPTATEIFQGDYRLIQDSDVLVAVLDGLSIDDGVAGEVGIAVGLGLPRVGIITDLRWWRRGSVRLYRNLFTIGMIESSLGLVYSREGLVDAIKRAAA